MKRSQNGFSQVTIDELLFSCLETCGNNNEVATPVKCVEYITKKLEISCINKENPLLPPIAV